ncbi:MAG: D-cysteine desulfhydrase family protein [Alcanivoracaceae bacterium]|nr:D-cysteine desulfhydrase family protein [Alcanivoracaceae bacterium]
MIDNKFTLAFLPTPLHKLNNLSKLYPDYNIFIKRDDQTGLASGGNKTRKLEYLIKQCIDDGCDTVFTVGAQQSNHCRQTAAACAVAGLECHLIVRGKKPKTYQGNLLLSHLLGAKIHFTGNNKKEIDFATFTNQLTDNNKPFIIPYGGSNITGALGYVEAVKELKKQLVELDINIDYIFFASSSGGTQAGLILGLELYSLETELIPIKIDKDETQGLEMEEEILKIIRKGTRLLNIDRNYSISDITLNKNYNQAAYGVLTDKEKIAINKLAISEAILLDPVYTGRAFYGMLDFLNEKKLTLNSNILFWHTGGLPALFDYADGLK